MNWITEIPTFFRAIIVGLIVFIVFVLTAKYKAAKDRKALIAKDPSKGIPITDQEIADFEAWLDERALPCANITVTKDIPNDLHGSRIGGPVPFAEGENWPMGRNEEPMVFLVQLNFSEIPKLPDYPSKGLLQLFVSSDDLFGMDFDDYANSDKKIIWYDDPNNAMVLVTPPNDVKSYSPYESNDVWLKGHTITFQAGKNRPHWSDWSIQKKLEEFRDKPNEDEVTESFFDQGKVSAHYVGGYPDFTQEDPRYDEEYQVFDRVLFQMGWDENVMWGDAGEAMFMITRDDLIARKFDRILYSWDCS